MVRKFSFGWTCGIDFSYYQNCSKFGCVKLGKVFLHRDAPLFHLWKLFVFFWHTLKYARDGSLIFFYPDYTNKIQLPNPDNHLYNCRSLTFALRPVEAVCRNSVLGRMTWSMSRNAAMNMPPPPHHPFHGYTHYYRTGLWSFTFVPTSVGPGTNNSFSPGSNSYPTSYEDSNI